MKACSPKVHIPFSQTVLNDSPLVSFVNMQSGSVYERVALFQGGCISSSLVSLCSSSSISGALAAAGVKSASVAYKCSSLFCREGRGEGFVRGQREKCGPTCHLLSSELEGLVLTPELQGCPTPLIC